jgi:hypothetical protein
MKKLLLTLTLLGSLALGAYAGGGRYNPYRGAYGGLDFDDGSSASYNPYRGAYGGFDFSNGSSMQYNPYKGVYGGWDTNPGYRHFGR